MELRLDELRGLRIAGTGVAFPSAAPGVPGPVDNAGVLRICESAGGLREPFDADQAWMRWGVRRRSWCRSPGAESAALGPLELAVAAARAALASADIGADAVDVLAVASSLPARVSRSTASLVAAALGTDAASFDVRAGGAGGLTALLLASSLLARGARRALVVAVETPSSCLAPQDLVGCLLYGDGAAAVLVERDVSHAGGLLGGFARTHAAAGRPFTVPGSFPPTRVDLDAGRYAFQREDAAYRAELAAQWRLAAEELARTSERTDLLLPYGVHRDQVRAAREAFGVAEEACLTTLERDACLGCAGTLVALHEALVSERCGTGSRIASLAVGGGVHVAGLHWEV